MIDRLPQTPIDTPGNAAWGAYAHPMDVVGDTGLTKVEKRRILTEWAEDARALKRASGEGMSGGENANLAEIERALDTL
ncbi:hypothetical protein [Microbaculum marinisediminis]|uniref:Uncharacterized protein n=1 Tax=Microbaculum marinisediminis TaxID=2931392 RepID=A0AAW5R442_9HYPH|nr:hypothetical protein [Microbaculum sp. A6E488]MCT8973643.1 hypothetical protein [Microbaculum sp. A6E488]